MSTNLIITLDIDWAPDFVIDFVADKLIKHRVKATWFVTHASPAVYRLHEHPNLFELGIHPNFLPGSSQGKTSEEILAHCFKLVPQAVSMRTHALVQSSPLLAEIMSRTSIKYDVSLFLPHAFHLYPVKYYWQSQCLWRIPYYWEDDFEMERPNSIWSLDRLQLDTPGLKVFDFHPIHVYLNSATMTSYIALKQRVSSLRSAHPYDIDSLVNHDIGTRSLFLELIDFLAERETSRRIFDIVS